MTRRVQTNRPRSPSPAPLDPLDDPNHEDFDPNPKVAFADWLRETWREAMDAEYARLASEKEKNRE
jgi:hypothetical protein